LVPEIEAAYREAISTGNTNALKRAEAAERLLTRVYGKPTETVKPVQVAEPDTVEELRAMPREARQALLRKLQAEGLLGTQIRPSCCSGVFVDQSAESVAAAELVWRAWTDEA